MPVAEAAGIVLNRGLCTRLDDVDGPPEIAKVFEKRCGEPASSKVVAITDLTEIRKIGLDTEEEDA